MKNDSADDSQRIAETLLEATRARDFPRVLACYSPDATVFVAAKRTTYTLGEHFAIAAKMVGRVKDLRYEDVRITPFRDGYVQQHYARGEFPDGSQLNVAACWVCRVRNGRIFHQDYYIDSSVYTALD
jgi:ketosteroid isomerase-like protein